MFPLFNKQIPVSWLFTVSGLGLGPLDGDLQATYGLCKFTTQFRVFVPTFRVSQKLIT